MQERKLVPVEQLRSEYKNINKWAVIVIALNMLINNSIMK